MKRLLTPANLRLAIEILLVTAAILFTLARSTPTAAAPDLSPSSPTAAGWYRCNNPDQVAAFTNRVHVHCGSTTDPIPGVSWFAVPTTPDSATASRFMSIIQSAMLTGRPLYLYVDPADLSGGSFNCNTGDCRRLYGVEMQ